MLDAADYKGDRLVVLQPTDRIYSNPTKSAISQLLAECGFKIDDQAMDWGTVAPVPDYRDPLLAAFIRGDGRKGWFGYPADDRMEQIYAMWLETTDPAARTELERKYELEAFEFLPFIPLGRYLQTSA